MEVIQNALLLNLKNPSRVLSVIPKAKMVSYNGNTLLAVKHGLDEVQVLRNLGIRAPSPVNYQWEYPGKFKPMAHQKATVEFLTLNKRAFVLNGMGSGKTASALWAADYLMTKRVVRRMLVVSPLSTLRATWEQEAFSVLPHRVVVNLHSLKRDKRAEAIANPDVEILLVNHDGLTSISSLIAKQQDIDLVVVDEAAAFRNSTTTRYKALRNTLIRPATRLWMMTGTPAPNAPTDVWALCRLVKPETVPTYFTQFKMMTMLQLSTYKWIPKHDAYDTAYRVMQPAIRFRLEDCVDLPPTTVIRKECELSPEQLKAYKAMTQHYAMQTDSGEVITAANAAVRLSKLIQIGLGGAYGADGEVHEIPATSRLEVLKESIEEAGAKVIVFVPFRSALQAVVKYLRQFWSVEYVDGTVSATKRAEIFKNFQQAADPHILVAHPKTAAHGLTLVAADTIVWYGPIFSNELYQQANARIVRTGQTRHTNIIELCASEVEKEAYALVKTKEGRQQKILSLYANVFDKH